MAMQQFVRELTRLKQGVVEMGRLAESMVDEAARALVAPERPAVDAVLQKEPLLDRFQVEIDREAIRLITIYAPVARDLRTLLMIARITSDLERIGDQAVDNCEYVELLPVPRPPLHDVPAMSGLVHGMVRDALTAFEKEDVDRAHLVMAQDDRVDALNRQIFRELLEQPGHDGLTRASTMSLILVARSLERIADHATNICEEVFYLVEGADIRHRA
jgi:phosphate transport system protein